MPRPTDCIYCGADTGSREHTFPAGLGGRRMNKGILCAKCNNKFSSLDKTLSEQLSIINGLIGVRPDRDDSPRPARIEAPDGLISIDSSGKPAIEAPKVLEDKISRDGKRKISLEFGSERQVQEWLAQQRAAGFNVKQDSRRHGQRFLPGPIELKWSFGGDAALREAGRIALNFFAHRWPEEARMEALIPFKKWVEGDLAFSPGECRRVWYSTESDFALPDSPFPFGHQILIVLDEDGTYARVRFFSTFDLFVWFGKIPNIPSDAVIYDINPLADRAPDDLKEAAIERTRFPKGITPPVDYSEDLSSILHARISDLIRKIEMHQWGNSTLGLMEDLNALISTNKLVRIDSIFTLLRPHCGRILILERFVIRNFKELTNNNATPDIIKLLELLVAADTLSPDGLSDISRNALYLCTFELAGILSDNLDSGPITKSQLRLTLAGEIGIRAVAKTLIGIISDLI